MKNYTLSYAITLITVGLYFITHSIFGQSNEFAVPLSDPSKRCRIEATVNFGSIKIKGTSRKDVLIKYSSKIEGDGEAKTKNGLRKIGSGGLELEVSEHANTVSIKSGSWASQLRLEIEVPAGSDIRAKAHNDGDIIISDIQGENELTNHNGSITATNISGSVLATTYNGEVTVSFLKVKEDTPMSFTTYNGDVDVSFPTSVKATLKMKTQHGDIYSDFDVVFKNTGPVEKKESKAGVYKVVIDEWKRGDINGGGPEMTIRNYNGDIYIRKK